MRCIFAFILLISLQLKFLDETMPDVSEAVVKFKEAEDIIVANDETNCTKIQEATNIECEKVFQRSFSENKMVKAPVPSISRHLEQERNLAVTLVRVFNPSKTCLIFGLLHISILYLQVIISIIFIICQSFKIIPDIFELMCERMKGADQCMSIPVIDYFVR